MTTTVQRADFEALLLPVLDAAYGTAYHFTRNRSDAEDLVQDAALLACRGFATFQPGTSFRAWFLKIVTNCFFQRYRRDKRRGDMVDLTDTEELYLYRRAHEAGLARRDDPAEDLIRRLTAEHAATAIQALPEEYRTVAALYFLHDLSYQDIAGQLGVPVGTVRSRLHRGRRLLQKALWELAEERGIVAQLAVEPA